MNYSQLSLINFNKIKIDVGLSFNAPMIRNWISNEENLLAFGFEPSVPNFVKLQSLEKSINLTPYLIALPSSNSLAFLINVALGETSYVPNLRLFETNKDSGGSSLHRPLSYEYKQSAQPVTIWALDDFFQTLFGECQYLCDHVKIDTQGHDFMVLKGATKLLEHTFFVTAEISVGQQYEVDALNELRILEFLGSRGFQEQTYFSLRKVIGRLLRLKYINVLIEAIRQVTKSLTFGTILEVPDRPSLIARFLTKRVNWIRFSDRTFANIKLIQTSEKRVFRIFQRG